MKYFQTLLLSTLLFLSCNPPQNADVKSDWDGQPSDVSDPCPKLTWPDTLPNLAYLSIFDTLHSLELFNRDTLRIQLGGNFIGVYPDKINGAPVKWYFFDNGISIDNDGKKLPFLPYIELCYESHCTPSIYVAVYDFHVTDDGEMWGEHTFHTIEDLDSILTANTTRKDKF